jgi:hypothetical protein
MTDIDELNNRLKVTEIINKQQNKTIGILTIKLSHIEEYLKMLQKLNVLPIVEENKK